MGRVLTPLDLTPVVVDVECLFKKKKYAKKNKLKLCFCDKVRHERRPAQQRNKTGSGGIFSKFHHSSLHNIPLVKCSYRSECSLLQAMHHHSYLTVHVPRSTSELMWLSCQVSTDGLT